MAGTTEKLSTQPGEFNILYGGTRNKINLNRPWQGDLPYDPERCPFCKREEEDVMESLPGWRVLSNQFTPHAFHRLVIPKECPSREATRVLCGEKALREALAIYSRVIPVAQAEGFERTVFAVHVGYLAGQNFGHMHWHVCDAKTPETLVEANIALALNKVRVISEGNRMLVYAEGYRAGQLYLVPQREFHINTFLDVVDFAATISCAMDLCSKKFTSTQGLPPEYVLLVVCHKSQIRYATYVPVLNHLGFPYHLAMSGDSDIVLPWPHDVTAAYLRGEISV